MAKILIVDDSLMMRAVLRNFIKNEGHDVVEGSSGPEAVEMFGKEKPDVVFLDILMPGEFDGLEALKRIKQSNPTSKVIMVTSLKEDVHVAKATESGANGYVMKPFSKQEIVDALHNNV